jgi:hypothetical protein
VRQAQRDLPPVPATERNVVTAGQAHV